MQKIENVNKLTIVVQQFNQIIGMPIVGFEDGSPLAMIKDIIIHPDTGKIEGFWVKPLTLPIKDGILLSDSILEWKKNVYIKDEREIAEPDEIIKIEEVLARETYFIGNTVKNESEEVIGKVFDVDFDTKKYYLKNIYIEKSIIGFKHSQRMLPYDSIIKVLPEYILVKDIKDKKETVEGRVMLDDKQPLLDV